MGTPEADEEAFLNMFKRREGEAAPDWVLPTEGLLEAMESVPLFMTQSPTDNVEGNPTLAALQSLLYEDTPEGNKSCS